MLIQNGEWLKRPAQSAGTSGLLYAGHNALRVTICINSWLKKTR